MVSTVVLHFLINSTIKTSWVRRGRDRMVVIFRTTYVGNAYHHWSCEFESWIRARCTTLCDKVCQGLDTGRWFSPGPSVSSTNKTDSHDIAEILLKVALNTIINVGLFLIDICVNCVTYCLLWYCFKFTKVTVFNYLTITFFFHDLSQKLSETMIFSNLPM